MNNSFSTHININDIHALPHISQKSFLLHSENKKQFIRLFCDLLKDQNILYEICEEDADRSIICTATAKRNENINNDIVIVGQDIDLLVLFIHFASCFERIYFYKPAIGKSKEKYFDKNSFKKTDLKEIILFLHAFSGCDTTSAFSGLGKKRICEVFKKYKDLRKDVKVFYDPEATKTSLFAAGQACIRGLYGSDPTKNLDLHDIRYRCFVKSTTSTACKLRALPPTKDAANQHTLRVYFQIQKWIYQTNKSASEYGWQMTINGLMPIALPQGVKPLPESLLESITCTCKSGCKTMRCSCKKVGLKCSMACKHCNGINCLNCEQKILSFEDGVDDNIEDNLSESHSEVESDSHSEVETSSESDLDDSSLYSLDNEIDRMITNQNESDTDIFSCMYYNTSNTEYQSDDSASSSKRRKIF